MSESTPYVCAGCNRALDPDAPDSIHAVERKEVTAFGADSPEYVDGLQVWFHEVCYPDVPQYRRFDS